MEATTIETTNTVETLKKSATRNRSKKIKSIHKNITKKIIEAMENGESKTEYYFYDTELGYVDKIVENLNNEGFIISHCEHDRYSVELIIKW